MSHMVEVKLLGKGYRVACEPAEREALLAAVAFLDAKLKESSQKTPSVARGAGERLAIMAALNLAHELLAAKNTPAEMATALETESIQRRIDVIEAKLDESLAQQEPLVQ